MSTPLTQAAEAGACGEAPPEGLGVVAGQAVLFALVDYRPLMTAVVVIRVRGRPEFLPAATAHSLFSNNESRTLWMKV